MTELLFLKTTKYFPPYLLALVKQNLVLHLLFWCPLTWVKAEISGPSILFQPKNLSAILSSVCCVADLGEMFPTRGYKTAFCIYPLP